MNRKASARTAMKYRWIVYGCLAAIYFFVYFHRLSLGVVKDDLTSAFNMSSVAFANIGAMYFYAYMIMQVPSGILADTLGPRKTVTAGCVVTSLGTFLFAAAHSVWAALAGRFLVGLGVSVTYICILKINTKWFRESEFATMSGLTGFIGNLGGIAAQTPLALMVAWITWRWTFSSIALVTLFMGIMCLVFVRNDPEDLGLQQVNDTPCAGNPEKKERISIRDGLAGVLSNSRTWIIFTVLTCYAGTYLAFAGVWGVSYLRTVYNFHNVQASGYITYLVTGAAFGYLITGYISDKMKSRKIPLLTFGILTNIIWFIMLYYNNGYLSLPLLKMMMILLGIFTTCFSVSWALGKEVNNPQYSGIAMSVINTGAFAGGALVPVLIGFIFDSYKGILSGIELYRAGFIPCLVINAVALMASFLVKETRCRNIYKS